MDFKKICGSLKTISVISFTLLFFTGCINKDKSNTDNTFYIELINFSNDSLKQHVSENIFGKVSFYKNNNLEILSLNYATDNLPDMHYFKNAATLKKDIKADTKKIRIEFKGNFSLDSIKYSLEKYKYKNNQWIKTSNMGEIRNMKSFVQPKNIIDEFVRLIVLNTVQYSYN